MDFVRIVWVVSTAPRVYTVTSELRAVGAVRGESQGRPPGISSRYSRGITLLQYSSDANNSSDRI